MLCEINLWGNFFLTWLFMIVISMVSMLSMSAIVFIKYYVNPTFETWKKKTNPNYPPVDTIKNEIVLTIKGVVVATLCPALSVFLANHGLSKAYCGIGGDKGGLGYHIVQFFAILIASDFAESMYHRLGHVSKFMWKYHKEHHVFFNISPFAVIADGWMDQFWRSSPLLVFPFLVPINMDVMFGQYILYYLYGVYLHSGFEADWPDAHHPWINTSFNHYWHHAVSTVNRPYYTGFFVKVWDIMLGSIWTGECKCAKCEVAKGNRSAEKWEKIIKPDYKPLIKPEYWLKQLLA